MASPWRGLALIGTGIAGFVGQVGDNRPHRHYAVQIAISPHMPVQLAVSGNIGRDAQIAGCPANVEHQLHATDAGVVVVYLEPTTPCGRLAEQRLSAAHPFTGMEAAALHQRACAAISAGDAGALTAMVLTMLDGPATALSHAVDPRIQAFLDTVAATGSPPEVTEAARNLALSPSRFAHVFSASCGISYRAFRKWRKLRAALETFAGGGTLTTAAHGGGFADSAHFSRTFAAMFGTSPSAALRGLNFRAAGHG